MSYPTRVPAARLRATEELDRERRLLAAQHGGAVGFPQGAGDILRWLTTGGPGPLTGELVGLPIPAAAIVHELATAEAVLAQPPGRCGRYAAGVLHTLMWAQRVMVEPPHSAAAVSRGDVTPV